MGEDSPLEKVEEIAIAVEDADEGADLFEDLFGLDFEAEWEIPSDDMRVKSAELSGTQIQMLESTSPTGVIAEFLEDQGEGIHHICFQVKYLEGLIERLREKDVKLIPEEPIEIGDVSYIFVHPKSAHGVMIELIEK